MNLRNKLRLSVLLHLPLNRAIRERYAVAKQQAPALFEALQAAPLVEQAAGSLIHARHVSTIMAVQRLLLEPTLSKKLVLYRVALIRGDIEVVTLIESELSRFM